MASLQQRLAGNESELKAAMDQRSAAVLDASKAHVSTHFCKYLCPVMRIILTITAQAVCAASGPDFLRARSASNRDVSLCTSQPLLHAGGGPELEEQV